jgi:IS5 family transposase
VQTWTNQNPEAVGTWLNEQPASTRKDAAVSAYAGQLAQKDGEAAALWANTITDSGARRTRVKSVVGTWAKKDGAAARAWVAGQRFPAAEQQELLQMLDPAGRK